MKLLLPATINPPRFRKDRSISISFDSRELTTEEIVIIMNFQNQEGWLCFAPNTEDINIPEERAEVGDKTYSERLRDVLYVLYKQRTESGKYTGIFESFRKTKMEQIIDEVKKKLE